MNREDAFYYENLLVLGFSDEYDRWLNSFLEKEDPLNDITLDLACCGSDYNKTISVLMKYRMEQQVDEASVCNRLRHFLKRAFESKQMDKWQVCSAMYTIASHIGDPGDFDPGVWEDMFYFWYYYSLAKDGILAWESFDSAFFAYLYNGIPPTSEKLWGNSRKLTFFERIKRLFKL